MKRHAYARASPALSDPADGPDRPAPDRGGPRAPGARRELLLAVGPASCGRLLRSPAHGRLVDRCDRHVRIVTPRGPATLRAEFHGPELAGLRYGQDTVRRQGGAAVIAVAECLHHA